MRETVDEIDASEFADSLFEHVAIGLAYINLNGRFLMTNKYLQKSLGYTAQVFKTLLLDEIVHPQDLVKLRACIQEIIEQTKNHQFLEIRCFDSIGNTKWMRVNLSCMLNTEQKPLYLIAAFEHFDINHDLSVDQAFNRKLFETIAENVPTTVWLASFDLKTIHYVNQAFLETWGVTQEQISTGKANDLLKRIHPDDIDSVRERIKSGSNESDTWEQSFRILNNDGSIRFIEDNGTVLRNDDGKAIYLLGTHRDVTERVQYTAQLETLNQELQSAYDEVTRINQFDTLTGCYNRKAILENISNAHYQFTRYEIPCTIIYIDLDQFKEVNDEYGHHAGDQVLKSFVLHMQKRIRQSDMLGRMGGDEFLLIFPGATKYNAQQFLKKQAQSFTAHLDKDLKLLMRYSVGVSEIDFKMESIDEWIDDADRLMYQQKNSK